MMYSCGVSFGCSIALSSWENQTPQLYIIDPSGVSNGYFGCAIGKAKQNAKTEIEKLKLSELSVNDLIKEAAKIIYIVHDEVKDRHFELELSWVCEASGWRHQRVPQAVFQEAERHAKAALEEDSSEDEEEEM